MAGVLLCGEISAQKLRLWQKSKVSKKKISREDKIYVEKSIQYFKKNVQKKNAGV